jgi:hypothetical protein
MDIQAASEIDVAAVIGAKIDATSEPRMPLGLIAFGALALVVQVLWLGLICWCLLNLF